MKERNPLLKVLDIQSSQIALFKAKWDRIDPERYPVERLQYLTENSQGTLVSHLMQRAGVIGKEHAPNDGNKQSNIARDYVLGAVFADEVMNTVPWLHGRIEPDDLTRFHNYLDSFPGNPYYFLVQIIPALSPNLEGLRNSVLEETESESKNYIATGFVEMYSIKLQKSLGSLPSSSIHEVGSN